MLLSEHVRCVPVAFKMTKWIEQQIYIKFRVKFEHSSVETIQVIQKAVAMGNWWLAASSGQHSHSCITSHVEFFSETLNHPGDSAFLQPRSDTLQLLAFPQTKITFVKEEISDHQWDSGKYDGAPMAIGRTVWGPKVPTWKGTEISLFYVQCFLYLVSSSVNVSIFPIMWLDTFWTDLIYLLV